ncbi:hypothetical protein ACO0K9_10435 [Undibacterium sp. Ji50W]|uniref:hypothetical protein n=1 Tax=Undibacterium sp. Ji50W TaxID=3413041 RepID=UPI003BEF7F1B
MGGNALQAESVRLSASRYREVELHVVTTLQRCFPQRRIEAVIAYADKADFGDLDILVEAGQDYDAAQLAQALQATEVVFNGDVTSMGLAIAEGVFQVDLIRTASASFDFASRYFGLNDFGNLVGRIAHKFGAKFGHLGLLYPIRDPDNSSHLIAEVCITTDFGEALSLLGYDAALYETMRTNGQFRTLNDIFLYVVASPYVNREIYLLDNRNHKARIRDAKRATYNAFLTWLDTQDEVELPAYPWAEAGTVERNNQKNEFLDTTFAQFPDFRLAYHAALADYARKKQVKRQFNGGLAAEITGLFGKELGELMARVRNSFADETSFENFFIEASPETIKAKFLQEAATQP